LVEVSKHTLESDPDQLLVQTRAVAAVKTTRYF